MASAFTVPIRDVESPKLPKVPVPYLSVEAMFLAPLSQNKASQSTYTSKKRSYLEGTGAKTLLLDALVARHPRGLVDTTNTNHNANLIYL